MELRNFFDGQFKTVATKQFTEVVNPATEELLAKTPHSSAEDVDRVVASAAEAFKSWKKVPPPERIQYLFKLKHLMEENFEDLAKTITLEHGKTLVESKGSVRRAIQMVETACAIPTMLLGDSLPDIAREIDCTAVRRPLGVFCAIVPFNFPAMVPFWFWPFAVATGNTFVLKASERVPLTSMKVFELLDQVGLPSGVMNLVHGGGEVAQQLCQHPSIRGVSFVGSTPLAKNVYQTASSHGKRVQALGGAKNVMVVLPDAVSKAAKPKTIACAVDSIIGCAGERCLAGSLILGVGSATYDSLVSGVVEYAQKVRVGSGLDPDTDMGPLINAASKDRILGLISRALEEGAELLLDGRQSQPTSGFFLAPTVLGGIRPNMEIAKTEIFGPVILLGKSESLDESIEWINDLSLSNTTTLFTDSGTAVRKFVNEVDPGMIGINIGVPAPMSFFSFGGSKESFFGDLKAHGRQGIDFYTEFVTTIYRWQGNSNIW